VLLLFKLFLLTERRSECHSGQWKGTSIMSLALGEVKLICEEQDGEMIIAEGYMDEVR